MGQSWTVNKGQSRWNISSFQFQQKIAFDLKTAFGGHVRTCTCETIVKQSFAKARVKPIRLLTARCTHNSTGPGHRWRYSTSNSRDKHSCTWCVWTRIGPEHNEQSRDNCLTSHWASSSAQRTGSDRVLQVPGLLRADQTTRISHTRDNYTWLLKLPPLVTSVVTYARHA